MSGVIMYYTTLPHFCLNYYCKIWGIKMKLKTELSLPRCLGAPNPYFYNQHKYNNSVVATSTAELYASTGLLKQLT